MASRFLTPFGGRGPTGRGDPFLDLHREMNRLFDDAFRGIGTGQGGQGGGMIAAPRVDVHETEDGIEVSAELPGVGQDDIDLRLENDVLTIRGEKRQERRDERAHIVERSYGSFQRSLQLPFSPNPDEVQARFENGVLKIALPRRGQQEKSRRIPIGGQAGAGQQTIEGSADPSVGGVTGQSALAQDTMMGGEQNGGTGGPNA